jgi:DNA repair protein RadA/Sms
MMLAVLQRRARLELGRRDVFAASVGGVRLTEPSVDLAVGLAVASAVADISVPADLVAFGEVGLAGEIRRVAGVQRRMAEAERMGFRRAIIPAGSASTPDARPAGGRRIAAVPAVQNADCRLEVTAVPDIRSAIAATLGAG